MRLHCDRASVAWIVALCSLTIVGSAEPLPDTPPIHRDRETMERAVLDATQAFMREDAATARTALDRLAGAGRELAPEESAHYGSAIVNYDNAYQATLRRAREHAGRGEVEDAFNQFVWVQRTCRVCHGLARQRGLLSAGRAQPAGPPAPSP